MFYLKNSLRKNIMSARDKILLIVNDSIMPYEYSNNEYSNNENSFIIRDEMIFKDKIFIFTVIVLFLLLFLLFKLSN